MIQGEQSTRPAAETPSADEYRFRMAFESFRQIHEFRKDKEFMERFRVWVRDQARDMAHLLDTINQ